MATFTEQFHRDMPPPGWLHVNGVSLSTDVEQTKQVISPPIPNYSLPFPTTANDGSPQKFENADLPKKLFIDRQIKKAKSLPGLIKGTALSHHSAPHTNATVSSEDDPSPIAEHANDNDSSRTQRTTEIRRPRVSFSEFNKVQFFEDGNDNSQPSTHRHHRHRSPKKSPGVTSNNRVSPPSIQHSQSLYAPYRPLSRQQPGGHELNIRKQQLNPSPRAYSSRPTHLPDIFNQSLSTEISHPEKSALQRERTALQFPQPAAEITGNSSAEMSRENTRAGGTRPAALDHYDQNENSGTATGFNSISISSSLANRSRPSLRNISLRQQFSTPLKAKPIQFSNNNNHHPTTNSRRSASFKNVVIRNQSAHDDDHDDLTNIPLENRPVTGISNPSKQVKRNYIIHFNPKTPFNGNSLVDSNETFRHSSRSNTHESSHERFENVLKIVRPPYITSLQNSHVDSILPPTANQSNGSRSSRNTSAHEYHLPTNTVYV